MTQQNEILLETPPAAPTEKSPAEAKKEKGMFRWEETLQKFQESLEDPTTIEGKYYARMINEGFTNAFACFEFSVALLTLLHKLAPPNVAFVLNSSTGKDSTIACHCLITAVQQEIQAGRGWNRPIAVAIADTGSEFPEMKTRMEQECIALNKLGETWKIPLTCHIVKPDVKHRLLVELCGNGKPVPAVSTSGKTQGVSAWCMDRVKAGSLKKIAQKMADLHGDYISILGVRSAESTKRKATMGKYGEDLPHGLSRIAGKSGVFTLASTPISHWPNREVSDFIRSFPPVWRPEGREEIRGIYLKGSPLEGDENYSPSECTVSISNEGQVSNSCSDLSGTRYGCWMCFLSTNKSLKNTARRESRYVWPKKFHSYLYNKGQKAIKRSSILKKMGFTKEHSFSKTFTFLERYKMLMFLFRSELESGFVLLEPEEETQVQKFWERHGVFCVTTQDARLDAKIWKETGRWKAFFEDIADESHRLCLSLSEGFPYGAIVGLESCAEDSQNEEEDNNLILEIQDTKKKRAARSLEMTHLLAFAGQGFGTPPYPKMLAYVFQEKNPNPNEANFIITALTDTPCLLGLPTNTGLLNGMSGTQWDCIGIRQLTPWEKSASDDRNFVYQIDPNKPKSKTPFKSCPPLQIMEWAYQTNLMTSGVISDDPLKDEWFDLELIHMLQPMDDEQLKAIFSLSQELTITSDQLTDHFSTRRNIILKEIEPYRETILVNSEEGTASRGAVRKIVLKGLNLPEIAPTMRHYARCMKLAAQAIRIGILNSSLLLKLSYIHQMLAVDPREGEELLLNLLKHIPQKPKEKQNFPEEEKNIEK